MDRPSTGHPILDSDILDVLPLRTLAPLYPGPFGYAAPFTPPNSHPPFGGPPYSTAPLYSSAYARHAHPAPDKPTAGPPFMDDTASAHASDVELVGASPSPSPPPPPQVKAFNGGGASSAQKKSPTKTIRKKLGARKTTGSFKKTKSSHPQEIHVPTPARQADHATPGSTPRQTAARKPKAATGSNLSSLVALGDPRQSVERALIIFDGLRRRLSQIEDASSKSKSGAGSSPSSSSHRPDLKAGSTMSSQGVRVNAGKTVGATPGVEIGDIFFFRFEMCIVGLHAPSMAGIDYMTEQSGKKEDPTALSIVSSGGVYENDMADSDVLIYTGQGGITTPGKHVDNQKLERGNLALQRSLEKGNEIRVVRGVKDLANPSSKIYIYDGLYKVRESWTEQGREGFSVFKFKLVRVHGQPEGSARWKRIQHWKDDPFNRPSVILPDISSGVEKMPICLVNEVDNEKGPAYFTYTTKVKYLDPVDRSVASQPSCQCPNSCSPSASSCSCKQLNGGLLPYTSSGLLVVRKQVIYECGSCSCSINCRNRVSQRGINFRFEVFRTKNKGWGLRSWDPIRAGSFICEFVGEVSNYADFFDAGNGNGNDYVFDSTASTAENSTDWNYRKELVGVEDISTSHVSLPPLSIVINAQKIGNISRFMNHSCSPNVFWQPVMFDHGDQRYPHIVFYATKHIPPLAELTCDYGSKGSSSNKKNCFCGSPNCPGFFYG